SPSRPGIRRDVSTTPAYTPRTSRHPRRKVDIMTSRRSPMRINVILTCAAAALSGTILGCDKTEVSAPTTQQVEATAHSAGEKLDTAAQKTGDALHTAAEKTGQALNTAAQKTGPALETAA